MVLNVTDSGSGISPEKLHRIFDAFFTTKDEGTGTGLGLAMVSSAVAEFGGAIDVSSSLGEGSSFTVFLPRSGDAAASIVVESALSTLGNHEQIMVVDDEPALVRLMIEVLSNLGYVPVGFTSSVEALAALRAYPDRFDAVITDERMPVMSGSQLIRGLRNIRPSIPILLVSGYIGGDISREAREAGASELCRKPLSTPDLATTLARMLATSRASAQLR